MLVGTLFARQCMLCFNPAHWRQGVERCRQPADPSRRSQLCREWPGVLCQQEHNRDVGHHHRIISTETLQHTETMQNNKLLSCLLHQ